MALPDIQGAGRLWEVSVVTFPMNEAAMVTDVKSIDDARRILREAAANPDEKAALRALLKEIRSLLDPEDDEEDLDDDTDDADEKEIALALRGMVLELKGLRRCLTNTDQVGEDRSEFDSCGPRWISRAIDRNIVLVRRWCDRAASPSDS